MKITVTEEVGSLTKSYTIEGEGAFMIGLFRELCDMPIADDTVIKLSGDTLTRKDIREMIKRISEEVGRVR